MKRPIRLSDHFNYRKLFRFSLPSILMMLATSVYSVIDGLFVSNFVGTTSFTAINLVVPILTILAIFGYIFGAGGSAMIAHALGEKDPLKAKQLFSLFVYLSIGVGIIMMIIGYLFLRDILVLCGAEGPLLKDCLTYGYIFLLSLPAWTLLYEFQIFFVTAQRQRLGLWVIIGAGICNIVLDALFIIVFNWGIIGAAAATAIAQCAGGLSPLWYFRHRRKHSLLHLTPTSLNWQAILKCCSNGSSELLSGISIPFVGMIYNLQLLKYAGENGVAAYGVILYASMVFTAIFFGFCNGSSPLFSYHYGAQNSHELTNLLKRSLTFILGFSFFMFAFCELFATPISYLFVSHDPVLLAMTERAFAIYSIAYIFMGVGIFSSALFTALGNGEISALISFLRTLVFELGAVLLIPIFWGIDGIWLSVSIAEAMAALVGVYFIITKRKKYRYYTHHHTQPLHYPQTK